jgi:hypothetical protein
MKSKVHLNKTDHRAVATALDMVVEEPDDPGLHAMMNSMTP